MHSVKKLSARLLFFAPKNQNEVGVFAFYVFFEADIDQKLSTIAIQSVARNKWYKRLVRQYIHFIH